MGAHSHKSKQRHPTPTTFKREQYEVGHITFEVIDHPDDGKTFALIAGEALSAKDRRPLFTGYVQEGIGKQMARLALRLMDLEKGEQQDEK